MWTIHFRQCTAKYIIEKLNSTQIFRILSVHNESKKWPAHELYTKHWFIQQENTLNHADTVSTFKTCCILLYMTCKILKKPTSTPKILHVNSPIRHIHNTNKFHQIRQHKPQQLHLYHILYILKMFCIYIFIYLLYFIF
jgi:hypothetical protein